MDGEEVPAHSREVARGSFWGLAGNMAFNLTSFAYVVLVARVVAQEDVGLFYLAFSVMSLLTVFDDLGLPSALLRYVPFLEAKGQKRLVRGLLRASYAGVALSAVVLIAVVCWQADFIGALYQNAALPGAIRAMAAFLLLASILKLNASYLQSRSDIRSQQAVSNFQNFLKLAFSLLFIYAWGPSFWALAAALLASQAAALALSFIFVAQRSADMPAEAETFQLQRFFTEIIPFGLMLSAAQSISVLLMSADKMLVGYFMEPAGAARTVAIYAMATALATLLTAFAGSIGNIFLPLMSRLFGSGDLAQMRAATATAQRWLMFATVPPALVMMAFPREAIEMIYGEQYIAGAAVLSVFALAVLIKAVASIPSLALASMRLVSLQVRIMAAVVGCDILLNLLLIPSMGMIGAAFALLAAALLMAALYHHYAWKLFSYRAPPELGKMLLSGGLALVLLLIAKPALLSVFSPIGAMAGIQAGSALQKALYLAFLGCLTVLAGAFFIYSSLLLKCFRKEDIAIGRKALQKAMLPQRLIDFACRLVSYGVAR